MAEVTRVPLQPIAKGSLVKLWLGIIVAIAIAAGLAWLSIPRGVEITEIVAGSGATPADGDVVFVKYRGTLPDGTEFDAADKLPIPVPTEGILPDGVPMSTAEGQTIPGFREGLLQMKKGGKYELFIPADMAYGAEPPPGSPIPPNTDLKFEIEVVDFMNEEDVQRRFAMLQQMMQMQQQQQGDAANPAAPQ